MNNLKKNNIISAATISANIIGANGVLKKTGYTNLFILDRSRLDSNAILI